MTDEEFQAVLAQIKQMHADVADAGKDAHKKKEIRMKLKKIMGIADGSIPVVPAPATAPAPTSK